MHIKILIIFYALLLVQSAIGGNFCLESELIHLQEKNSNTEISAKFKKEYVKKYYGDSKINLNDAIVITSQFVPISMRSKFVDDWQKILISNNISVVNKPANSFEKSQIQYKSRIKDFYKKNRIDNSKIEWKSATIQNDKELDIMINKVISIYGEAQYVPIRGISALRNHPKVFFKNNSEAIYKKLILQHYTFGNETKSFTKGVVTESGMNLSKLVMSQLPSHFFNINRANLNGVHLKILKEKGPKGLYKYILATESPSAALKYWTTHMINMPKYAAIILLPILAPKIYESYFFFKEKQQLTSTTEDGDPNYEAFKILDMSAEEIYDDINNNIDELELKENEKEDFKKMLDEINRELALEN